MEQLHTLTLNNGAEIPGIGLGVYQKPENSENNNDMQSLDGLDESMATGWDPSNVL